MITLIRIPAIDVFRFATPSVCLPLGLAYIASALEAMAKQLKVIDAIGEAPRKRTRWDLCYWKVRLLLRFNSARRKAGQGSSLGKPVFRGLSGLFLKRHSSKLQTALRNAAENGWHQFRVYFKKPWVSAEKETELFRPYDAVFRRIREQKLAEEIATESPDDTTLLHKRSVVKILRKDHDVRKEFSLDESDHYALQRSSSASPG